MNEKNQSILRALAHRLRESAESPLMAERARRWQKLNALQAESTPVIVSPEGAWREIDETISLQCDSPRARAWELALRHKLYAAMWDDDMVVDAVFPIAAPIQPDSWGVKLEKHLPDADGGAYKPIPPILDLGRDLAKLRPRQLTFDREAWMRDRAEAEAVFDGILTVTPAPGYNFWSCGMTRDVIDLIGMDKLLFGMYDEPENIHALMQFLTDDLEQYLDQQENAGLLFYNNGANLVGSGHCGLTCALPSARNPVAGNVLTRHLWGLAESQETVGVSPEMFAEFIWPYQKRILARFGLGYYGCCEPIEERLPYIRECANVRAISISPWANLEKCAGAAGRDYVLCHKPNPAIMCVAFNEAEIRKDLRRRLDVCAGLNNMFILKDTHTVSREPERFQRWVKIFREEANR